MNALTQPIDIITTRRDPRRWATWLAYFGLFKVMASEAFLYLIGWQAWTVLSAIYFFGAVWFLAKERRRDVLRQMPWALRALLLLMLLSLGWTNYPMYTGMGILGQLTNTTFALFLVAFFSWRQLLRIFAGVLRWVLWASLAFELAAALIAHGPVQRIFGRHYPGAFPTNRADYWVQGELLNGGRFQGILGNANLVANAAILAIVVFAIEWSLREVKLVLSLVSMASALVVFVLCQSGGAAFALLAIALTAIVVFLAEGHDRDTRHRYYRNALTVVGAASLVVLLFRKQVFGFIGKSPDMTGRSKIWKAVQALIDQRPFQGWGWISSWMPDAEPFTNLIVLKGVHYYSAHNSFLEFWLQIGIVGFGLAIALVILTFVRLWRIGVRHTNKLYLWPVLVFVGLIVHNLIESRLLIENGWVLFVLFVVKAADPIDSLEPMGVPSKRVQRRQQRKLKV